MRKKKLTTEEIMAEADRIYGDTRWPELVLITCKTCENSIVIEKRYEKTAKEAGAVCDNCTRLNRFKDDIKFVFEDKEFVQCLKELMKEKNGIS